MNIQLKQRLVGAVVLISLAVIVIPMLLPGEGDIAKSKRGILMPAEPDYRFTPLEDAPPAPSLAEAPPVPLGSAPVAEKETAVEKPVPETTPSHSKPSQSKPSQNKPAPKKPSANVSTQPDLPVDAATPKARASSKKDAGAATAWVVQVGSFSNAKNARALRDKLRKQGYSSFVEAVKNTAGKSVYRVRVGPEVRRDLADKRQQQLVRDAGLKGIVLRYP